MEIAGDLFGLDLVAENNRLRVLNSKLTNGIVAAGVAAAFGVGFGIFCLAVRPEPNQIAVDPGGRVYPVVSLTKGDPPDAKITRMTADCINSLLNHAFHNFQTTAEAAIGDCITGGGSESVRQVIYPLFEKMKKDQMNMASSFVIQPFINSRGTEKGRNVFHVQGVLSLGYRGGKNGSTRPQEYAFESDVVRVSYDSQINGIRLQNLILAARN